MTNECASEQRIASDSSSSCDESDSSQSPPTSSLFGRSRNLKKVLGINALSKVNLKKVKRVKKAKSSVDVELLGESLAACHVFNV